MPLRHIRFERIACEMSASALWPLGGAVFRMIRAGRSKFSMLRCFKKTRCGVRRLMSAVSVPGCRKLGLFLPRPKMRVYERS